MARYPGWGLDLRWMGTDRDIFHPMPIYHRKIGNSSMMPVREVAMLLDMDRLADKPNWHIKVFDDEIATKWKAEALAWPDEDLWECINVRGQVDDDDDEVPVRMPTPILDNECLDYCILELRHKAEHFKRTGITVTLDASLSIAKSDDLVSQELQSALRRSFARLKADQGPNPDWHPNTGKTVQNLVHPSMYSLVYGRSLVLRPEVVGVEDAVDKFAGKGTVIPRLPELSDDMDPSMEWVPWMYNGEGYPRFGKLRMSLDSRRTYLSTMYQWLPANVVFTAPVAAIEKLIDAALPMWDQCLQRRFGAYGGCEHLQPGRHAPRFPTPDYGVPRPCECVFRLDNPRWDPESVPAMLEREAAENPGGKLPDSTGESKSAGEPSYDYLDNGDPIELEKRWYEIRRPVQVRPPAFSARKANYAVDTYSKLRTRFRHTGLQIIVKMTSIELTPENPEFSPGKWHVGGQMNERIVATALYYLDSENITDSHLEFGCSRNPYQSTRRLREAGLEWDECWVESIYGTRLGSGRREGSNLQSYGSVLTPHGRLLAFPNTLQHRVSGFRLADPTKPGHRRCITLWLVDPMTRIISTANVPPPQHNWWDDSTFGTAPGDKKKAMAGMPAEVKLLLAERRLAGKEIGKALMEGKAGEGTLPVEVLDMVRKELGDWWPISSEEIKQHYRELIDQRSGVGDKTKERKIRYNFCGVS
ncbi:hypothetical protein F5144DRAFT_654177 [Chaetomium tenue]|uniref:Uncharacterized protein n=1 Tax=Chaetomium tenue TaxID=1854479 RepID=A0ACB7P366_9PEZI|nr:hypothetical protein F5144DRAFT_654177 [Chaetomium globosum]